jgi:hypothetical protein
VERFENALAPTDTPHETIRHDVERFASAPPAGRLSPNPKSQIPNPKSQIPNPAVVGFAGWVKLGGKNDDDG